MSFHQVQAQPFSLAGAGAIAGATTIVLKSFAQINGTLLTMTDFGAVGYLTMEPGNSTFEEQISFTGVVQNSNGTATLSGIKTVLDVSPYTETSGLAQTHAGSTTLVLSNTAGFYAQFPAKQNDETITGQWTFNNFPITPSNTPASTTVAGIVQEATNAQILAKTAAGSTGAQLFANPATQASTLLSDYVVDTGAADAYVITPSPAVTAYTTGQAFSFKAVHANTTTSTLAVNGLTAKTIKLPTGNNLTANTIIAGQIVVVEYDGTNFQMTSPPGNLTVITPSTDVQTFNASGTWTKPASTVGTMAFIQAWGGGGAGANDAGGAAVGGGGGGGGYAWLTIPVSSLGSTETVTVPATTVSGGASGGSATFGSWLTAYGGGGGTSNTSGEAGGGGGGPMGGGGTPTAGNPGSPFGGTGATTSANGGIGLYGAGAGMQSGNGGNAYYGGGGGGGSSTGTTGGTSVYGGGGGGVGTNGTAPGGGGGAQKDDGTGSTGMGAAGRVIVTVY